MADIIRIWVEISHQPAFRCGGWAFVRAEGSALTGAAGGERSPSAERIALAGVLAGLKDLPAGRTVEVRTAAPAIAALARRVGELDAGGEAPAEDLDLWAQLTAARNTHRILFGGAVSQPRTPTAFAAAWAELARDKAKSSPFSATIPKANLAKAWVPA